MSRQHPDIGRQGQEPISDRGDDGGKVAERTTGCSWTAVEQGVAGEQGEFTLEVVTGRARRMTRRM